MTSVNTLSAAYFHPEDSNPMLDNDLIRLNAAVSFADHAIREGHVDGLRGLREVERDLLAALHAAAPAQATIPGYRYAVDTLADLRKAIATEVLLEDVPEEDLINIIVPY